MSRRKKLTEREALQVIAGFVPTPPDLTASDLDDVAIELYQDSVSTINIARRALGLEPIKERDS